VACDEFPSIAPASDIHQGKRLKGNGAAMFAFGLRDGDHVRLRDRSISADTVFRLVSGTGNPLLAGLSSRECARLRDLLQDEQTLEEVISRLSDHIDEAVVRDAVQALAGKVLFAPRAVAMLESQVPMWEIVRDPARGPYAVDRCYWENMAAVRQALASIEPELDSTARFRHFLARLHCLAIGGADGQSRYVGVAPQSKPPDLQPGHFRTREAYSRSSTYTDLRGLVFARVLDDPFWKTGRAEYRLPSGTLVAFNGEPWESWTVHPMPPAVDKQEDLITELIAELRNHLQGALRSAHERRLNDTLAAVSRFHRAFVLGHPFVAVNNSLAMNVVNFVLGCASLPRVPHGSLGLYCMSLASYNYEKVFSTFVSTVGKLDPSRIFPDDLRRFREFEALPRRHHAAQLISEALKGAARE
jgi:hypothetical protein